MKKIICVFLCICSILVIFVSGKYKLKISDKYDLKAYGKTESN